MLNFLRKSIFIVSLLLPAILFQFLAQQGSLDEIILFLKSNLAIYSIFILVAKISGVIYPPFPGTLATFSAIPIIGWETAYILDIAGSFIGSSITFYLGHKYGYSLMLHILGNSLVSKIKKIKLKKRNQLESAIIVRFASLGFLSDGIVWGASMWGFSYKPFIAGYMIAHFISTAPLFLLLGLSVSFSSWLITFGTAILAWVLLYRFKGRYFE